MDWTQRTKDNQYLDGQANHAKSVRGRRASTDEATLCQTGALSPAHPLRSTATLHPCPTDRLWAGSSALSPRTRELHIRLSSREFSSSAHDTSDATASRSHPTVHTYHTLICCVLHVSPLRFDSGSSCSQQHPRFRGSSPSSTMARFRDNPIVAFYQELKDCTRQSRFYNPPRDFVLASRLLEWLRERPEEDETSARAMIILETVYNRREPWAGAWNYFDVSMDKGHRQCWLKLLVILLQIAPDGSFARLLHVFNTAEIWDSKLSEVHRQESDLMRIVETTGIYSVEDCHDAVRGFLQRATELSTQKAITLNHGRELQPHVLLPITAKDPIDSGGQSNVFRIEVPLECISEEVAVYLEDLHYQARQDDHYSDGKVFSSMQLLVCSPN